MYDRECRLYSMGYSSPSFFTQSKPVLVGDLGTRIFFYVWGFIFHFILAKSLVSDVGDSVKKYKMAVFKPKPSKLLNFLPSS